MKDKTLQSRKSHLLGHQSYQPKILTTDECIIFFLSNKFENSFKY